MHHEAPFSGGPRSRETAALALEWTRRPKRATPARAVSPVPRMPAAPNARLVCAGLSMHGEDDWSSHRSSLSRLRGRDCDLLDLGLSPRVAQPQCKDRAETRSWHLPCTGPEGTGAIFRLEDEYEMQRVWREELRMRQGRQVQLWEGLPVCQEAARIQVAGRDPRLASSWQSVAEVHRDREREILRQIEAEDQGEYREYSRVRQRAGGEDPLKARSAFRHGLPGQSWAGDGCLP
jgi:hypothetical protein